MEVKTAISIPDPIFEAAEDLAERLGVSRSRLYSEAVERFVADHRNVDVTERLDAIYCEEPARVDPHLEALQTVLLDSEDW